MSSTVGLIHIFTYKSPVSLSTGSFSFGPLQNTFLNFTKEVRSRNISQGRTAPAYLPVSFKTYCKANEAKKVAASLSNQTQIQIDRDTFLQRSRHSIEKSLGNVRNYVEQKMICQSADGFFSSLSFCSSLVHCRLTRNRRYAVF